MRSTVHDFVETITNTVNRERLLETAIALVEVPSPTRSAAKVADRLDTLLRSDGFEVERPDCDWPESPAVVARMNSGDGGRVLQVDGHLDTVHLKFVPPRVEDGILYGSGCSDMKGGIAAAVEAMRVVGECGALTSGGMLLTAHDHHEGPWGDSRQMKALISQGYLGDGVMLPEYLADFLPVAGRGMFIFEISVTRDGDPVHEVLRPIGQPDVVAAAAELVSLFHQENSRLSEITHPYSGCDSFFVGLMRGGEIFNQSATSCEVKGTRRWVTPGHADVAIEEFNAILQKVAGMTGAAVTSEEVFPGDAFEVDAGNPLVKAFQHAHADVTGAALPFGAKPFVDDGNTYATVGGIPALTHGPAATGAHTLNEQVPIDELVRLAKVYALTAINFCNADCD